MFDSEFENEQYLQYENGATFGRRCEKCYRFLRANNPTRFNWLDESFMEDLAESTSAFGQ